ncbi:recombinase family protein [Brevibacillus laterosporus]|uniref:recombinase family protein n=1 Tax=Brevibacillus laterosporus TaxID=1465 RepID=UPI000EB34AB6|nr:recombinase family protein [Brevibacillus laterosporus]AYK05654.1 recombinase family protein [Brevibacillus laterosporus]
MTSTAIPVAIYARVSTDRQGDSIEHQVSFLREYVSRNLGEGYYTDDTLIYSDEGISGYSTTILDRPAMKQLLDDAKKGVFKVVLIKELTRFGRDDEDNSRAIHILEASGVRVRSNDGYDTEQQHTKMFLKFKNIRCRK